MQEKIAQIIGFAALACAVCSFQQNKHKRILFFQILSGSLFTVHFTLLGAVLGGVLNFFGMLRSIVFYNKDKAWAQGKKWLFIFSTVFVATGIFFWEGIISIFPILSMVLSTICFWVTDPKKVRLLMLPASPLWMVYNAVKRSYGGFLTETFVLCSVIVGMIRFDFKKKTAIDK